jgi:hypothetical protein
MIKERKVKFNPTDRKLEWNSNGLKTKLFQYQGRDIILTQKREGHYVSYSPYSDPAHELFTCLLNYLQENDNLPELETIVLINGIPAKKTNHSPELRNAKTLTSFYLNEQLPFFQNDKIIIPSINEGAIGTDLSNFFFGYVHDKKFAIGITSDKGISVTRFHKDKEWSVGTIKNLMTLDEVDALNVLRGIYSFSPDNESLREVYNSKNTQITLP